MGKTRYSRKRVYVSHAIQGRLLVRLGLYFVVYHVFLWHVLFLSQELPSGRTLSFAERYAEFFGQNAMLLVCMTAVLPIILWDMVKFSHRIVGPFVRFERVLKQLAQGQPVEPISPRKDDLATELLNVLNDFIVTRNRELRSAQNHQGGVPTDFSDEHATGVGSTSHTDKLVGSYGRS